MPYGAAFDLIAEDKRIEVKCARPSGDWNWVINFHTHGVLDESKRDVYLILLEGVPGSKMPLYLVIPAPFGRMVLTMSLMSLLRDYSKYIDNWKAIGTPTRNLTALGNHATDDSTQA